MADSVGRELLTSPSSTLDDGNPDDYTIVLEEWNGSSSTKLSRTAIITASPSISIQRCGNRFSHVFRRVLEAFVPEGFPSSVTPDYVPFQVWDSLQGLSTYIRTMLSTQAVTYYSGMLMDLVSPLYPSAFVFVVCLGSLSRSFTGVASGATRAALTQHFALQSNAADISAKEGSQETVATMVGMAIGMLLAHVTIGHPIFIWILFLSLTIFHMYANYKAVQCLALTSLNTERSSILLQHFIKTGQVLSPAQVSKMEHILPTWVAAWDTKNSKNLHKRINLGTRVSLLDQQEIMGLRQSAKSRHEKGFLLGRYLLTESNGKISVVAHRDATAPDILQSYIHALVEGHKAIDNSSIHLESISWMDKNYADFLQKVGRRNAFFHHQSYGWHIGASSLQIKRLTSCSSNELHEDILIDSEISVATTDTRSTKLEFDETMLERMEVHGVEARVLRICIAMTVSNLIDILGIAGFAFVTIYRTMYT